MKPYRQLAMALTLAAPLIAVAAPASRATAQTDAFELVAVLQPGTAPTLTIYLDATDSNAPIADASIEVESGAFKATAKPAEPGVYTLPAAALAKAGTHPLVISIQSPQGAELMDATLEVSAQDEAITPQAATMSRRWPWLASLGLVLLLIAGAWLRQRQRVRTPSLQGKDLKDKP